MNASLLRARLELLVWLLLAASFYGLSFRFADAPGTFAWGPAAWPRAVLLIMVAAAVAHYLANRPVRHADNAERDSKPVDRGEILNTIGMIALPLVYLWLIPRAGFYVSTLLFLPAYMLHMGERRWLLIAGVTLGLFLLVNLIFTRLFYVALPTGSWPGFYDLSNWFVTFVRM